MVNIKSATIFGCSFATMLANYIALPDFSRSLEPSRIINRRGVFSEILANIVVNFFANVADLTAFLRTVFIAVLLNRLSAHLTRRIWFSARYTKTILRTILGFGKCFTNWLKFFSTYNTDARRFWFSFPVTNTRTVFRLFVPVFSRCTLVFGKLFAAVRTIFRIHSIPPFLMYSIPYIGNN